MSQPALAQKPNPLAMSVIRFFRFHATKAMAQTPRGRAFMLHQLADAEGGNGGELAIFDHLLAYVEDPKLRQIMTIHKEDEERHEQIYRERARAQGADNVPVRPVERNLLSRLDNVVQFLTRPVETDEQVMEAYLLLWVIEERAAAQFSVMRDVFAAVGDNESAAVFDGIERDEIRHLKYCHAVTKRYAPSEEVRQERLAYYRKLEADLFNEEGKDTLSFALDNDIVTGFTATVLKGLQKLMEKRQVGIEARFELSAQPA